MRPPCGNSHDRIHKDGGHRQTIHVSDKDMDWTGHLYREELRTLLNVLFNDQHLMRSLPVEM